MRHSAKIALLVGAILVILGIAAILSALVIADFRLGGLSSVTYHTETYSVETDFDNIDIRDTEYDIRLRPSKDGTCRVICDETEKIFHTVTVENGTLTVTRTDTRAWYECIGIFWSDLRTPTVTVYLPMSEYRSLYSKTVSGNIDIAAGLSFADTPLLSAGGNVTFSGTVNGALSAKTVSGDIVLEASAGDLTVSSTSGDISLPRLTVESLQADSSGGDIAISSATVSGNAVLKAVSGNVNVHSTDAGTLQAKTTSGDIELSETLIDGTLDLEAVSGSIQLSDTDAASLRIKTVSGDVEGYLLSAKSFVTHTTSGNVRTPASDPTAGSCEVTTTSGDIRLRLR